MVRYDGDLRVATTAFEAAMWQNGVIATCRCTHFAVFDPHALWWLCHRRGWDDRFAQLARRFYCSRCYAFDRRKHRPKLGLTSSAATFELEMPSEREWKKAMKRVRS